MLGFVGPAYQQASQMVFSPTGMATETSPIDPQTQADADGDIGNTQPISTATSSQFSSVYTSSTPMATHAQGNYMTGFSVGWNPATGFRMPPEYMVLSSAGQPSSSASQPMNQQINASAPQPTQSQDTAPAPQPPITTASAPLPTSPNNMLASGPTSQQQNLAMMIQPKSPTEVLGTRLPRANEVTWVFHDPVSGYVRHVNAPNIPPVAQQPVNQGSAQANHSNEMVLYRVRLECNERFCANVQAAATARSMHIRRRVVIIHLTPPT